MCLRGKVGFRMNNKITTIATSMIAFFTFLATGGLIVYYAKEIFEIKGLGLSFISEIYILFTLLFVSWVIGKIK